MSSSHSSLCALCSKAGNWLSACMMHELVCDPWVASQTLVNLMGRQSRDALQCTAVQEGTSPEVAVQGVEARVAAVRALAAVVQELAGTGGGGGGGTSLTQGSNCAIVSGALLGAMDDYTTDNRWGRLFEVQGKGRLGSCCAPAWTAGGRRQFQRRNSLAYCSAANAVMQRLRCAGCRPPLCAL